MLKERRHEYDEDARQQRKGFDPDEPRDDQGRWTDGGGGGGSADGGGGGGPPRARSADEAQRVAAQAAGGYAPLAGLPQKPIKVGDEWYVPGPIGAVKAAAETYMKLAGISYEPPATYLKVDTERAGRIASEFEAMKHDPSDPATKASYAALAKEVAGQWQSVKSTGLKIEFIKADQEDPYKTSLRMAAMDVIHNNHLWVFPTTLGFGSGTEGAAAAKNDNPMLQETGEVVDGHRLLVNDQFRIVHDYFGHFKEGVGFRADGEENAWRSHAAMFTPLARAALTSETRGQNSWLNFGPPAEHNRTASPADTIYAPQKIGIMADWASEEGRRDPTTKGYGDGGSEWGGGKDKLDRGAVSYSYISLRQAAEVLDAETYRKFADVAYRFFSATGELTRLDEVMIAVRAREPREDTEIELWPEEDENEDDFMDRCVGELTVCIGDRADSVCAEKWDASQELGKKGFVTLSMLSGDLAIAPCGTSCLGCRGRGLDDEVAPLYVHRDLQNVEAFTAWAQAQGFDEVVDDPHVTVLYSKTAVDWSEMGRGSTALVVLPGGARKIEQLGDEGAVVLRFESKALAQRHDEMVENGASHDYDSYVPHVTINLSGVIPDGAVPYDGELIFGPEIFETIDVKTKEFDESKHPRVPAGSPEGGQFGEGGGGGGGGDGAPSAANYGLVPGDAAKFKALKAEWATVNNELLEHVDDPDGPETTQKLFQLEAIVKEMHGLHADPGGPGGIGLPGGPRDVLIVGAGPGGLAASINGAAEGLDTLVVEANVVAGGQAKFSSRIENFPGFPVGVTGERLTQDMFTQAQRLGAEATLGVRVTGMTYDASTGLKHITLSNGEQIDSRTVILAGGLEFRRIPFTGSEGSGVIIGDGKALAKAAAGGPIVVVGGSNGAAQAALGAAAKSTHVYLLARSPIVDSMSDYQVTALRANPKVTVIESDSIAKLWRDEHGDPEKVETVSGKIFPVKAVGIFAGSVPETKWVPATITRDKAGRLHTNKDLETELPGVYAVGDMREGAIGRVGVAVGEGQLSLRQANMFLTAQQEAAAKAASAPKKKPSTKLITDLFDLDRANPWFGQTVEGVTPLKKKGGKQKLFDPGKHPHEPAGSPEGGQFAETGGEVDAYSVSENAGIDSMTVSAAQVAAAEKAAKEGAAAGAARALAAGVKPLTGSQGHPASISSRRITSKRAGAELLTTYAQPSVAAMKIETKAGESVFHDNVSLLKNAAFYPNMRAEDLKGSDDEIARRFIDHAKANMKFLYELMPAEEREANRIWYDGARVIVNSRAAHYGLNDAATAAVYASLSPQMLWDINVALGDQMIDTWVKHQDTAWDAKMDAMRAVWSSANQPIFDKVVGKKLSELTDSKERAVWMRSYIQTHYDQGYRYVLANGAFDGVAHNKPSKKDEREGRPGKLSGLRPQSLPAYTAAVRALESNGDPAKISAALSDTHKVRSFYNNILDPHAGNGDVTIDTHQVGSALLRPLGGSSAPVLQNFELGPDKADQAKMQGEWQAARGSAVTGSHGTYGFYADATRELAKELGLQPRQLQSIVWVMKRQLMPDTLTNRQYDEMEGTWRDYHDGKLDLAATQKRVVEIAHG